jgi:hypothetical protein
MTTNRKLKIIFGLLSAGLFTSLLFKLKDVPDGMILPGSFLGGMIITGIILGCFILAGILRIFVKRTSFFLIFFITTTISFAAFYYQLYSPTLTIKVPNGYAGEINLVLSNVDDNVLTVDTNGIGYINKWTFNKTYTKPIVVQLDGKNLDKNLVGFNPSVFFGKGKWCCVMGKEIESLSFGIVPDEKIGQKEYDSKDITPLVDKKMVQFSKPDEHTRIQTETIPIDTIKK